MLIEHAKRELAALRTSDENPDSAEAQDWMEENILDCVQSFADGGHSGGSAGYAVSVLEKLLRFEPLGPLTGEDDEWAQVMDHLEQNKRCSHVFRENGQAYDIDAIHWRDPDGTIVQNYDSRRNIEFPYTPTTEIRARPWGVDPHDIT